MECKASEAPEAPELYARNIETMSAFAPITDLLLPKPQQLLGQTRPTSPDTTKHRKPTTTAGFRANNKK